MRWACMPGPTSSWLAAYRPANQAIGTTINSMQNSQKKSTNLISLLHGHVDLAKVHLMMFCETPLTSAARIQGPLLEDQRRHGIFPIRDAHCFESENRTVERRDGRDDESIEHWWTGGLREKECSGGGCNTVFDENGFVEGRWATRSGERGDKKWGREALGVIQTDESDWMKKNCYCGFLEVLEAFPALFLNKKTGALVDGYNHKRLR